MNTLYCILYIMLGGHHLSHECSHNSNKQQQSLPLIRVKQNPAINSRLMFQFIHSFIHSRIYKAPLQEIYSEEPPTQPRRYRSVLSNLQNALSLFLGRIRVSKGSSFQVEGPTMENARRCLVAVLARGTNS